MKTDYNFIATIFLFLVVPLILPVISFKVLNPDWNSFVERLITLGVCTFEWLIGEILVINMFR